MYSTVDIHGNTKYEDKIFYRFVDIWIGATREKMYAQFLELLVFRLETIGAVAMNMELKVLLSDVDLKRLSELVQTFQLQEHLSNQNCSISIPTSK